MNGIINNLSINETFDDKRRIRIATCVVSCSSMRTVLDNRVAGIKTNPNNWNFLYPDDTSMDRVPLIASNYFDFGASPQAGSQATTASNGASTNTTTPTVTPTVTTTPTPSSTETFFLLFEDSSIATAENNDNIEIEH